MLNKELQERNFLQMASKDLMNTKLNSGVTAIDETIEELNCKGTGFCATQIVQIRQQLPAMFPARMISRTLT
jgi:hypothetical protein